MRNRDSELTHPEFVSQFNTGSILVGFDPAIARRLFMDGFPAEVGEPIIIERAVVWLLATAEFGSLLAGLGASVAALGWFSIAAVPLMLLTWVLLAGRLSMGQQSMALVVVAALVLASVGFMLRDAHPAIALWSALLPIPYLFGRLKYKSATFLLRALCVRNASVYELLRQHQEIWIRNLD